MDLQTVDKLLTTTRSVRIRLDLRRPVPPHVIQECIEIAIQAPSGSNRQGWHFMVVTDAQKRAAIGEYYRESFMRYLRGGGPAAPVAAAQEDPRAARARKVRDSALYLAEHMGEVPVLVIPCLEGRIDSEAGLSMSAQAGFWGSILPATWSLMLALRARGLGAAWTTLHLAYAQEIGTLLGIPENVTQAALLPVAYFTGEDFQPAARIPGRERTYWDRWGTLR